MKLKSEFSTLKRHWVKKLNFKKKSNSAYSETLGISWITKQANAKFNQETEPIDFVPPFLYYRKSIKLRSQLLKLNSKVSLSSSNKKVSTSSSIPLFSVDIVSVHFNDFGIMQSISKVEWGEWKIKFSFSRWRKVFRCRNLHRGWWKGDNKQKRTFLYAADWKVLKSHKIF